jgi:hypothetical protein
MNIYTVIDDRQGMNTILATYDNEESANAHREALSETDKVYGDYFLVERHHVQSLPADAE